MRYDPPMAPRRTSRPVRLAAACLLAVVVVLRAAPAAAQDVCALTTTERIVAVGDIHGAYDAFVSILQVAGLLDDEAHWAGGRAVFVQTGDVVDRGPASRQALDLLRRLDGEAEAAGGRVYALLGNHEVMRMYGITRDASQAEYEAFRTSGSEGARARYYRSLADELFRRSLAAGRSFDEDAFRERFFDDTPLGAIEMRAAFAPRGEYGDWLIDHPTMIKLNDIVFMHAGASLEVAALGCEQINARVRSEIAAGNPGDDALSVSASGPLWYRDLMLQPEPAFRDDLARILEALAARAMVIGHTTSANGQLLTRFGRRIVEIDTGMLGGRFYARGQPAALEIDGSLITAIYEDRRELLGEIPAGIPSAGR